MITETQQQDICRIVLKGCDRETACAYVDCTQPELRETLSENEEFGRRLRRSEAEAELRHMERIEAASKDEKNWRVSVWWFERRSPERFARRAATVTVSDVNQVIDQLEVLIAEEIKDATERQRLLTRLERIYRVGTNNCRGGESEADTSYETTLGLPRES